MPCNRVLAILPLCNAEFEVGWDFAVIVRAQGCHGIKVPDPATAGTGAQKAQRLNQEGTPVLNDVYVA